MNALAPDKMSSAERLGEVAQILAGGLMRLIAHKSSGLSAPDGDSFLDFSPPKSGGARKPRCRIGGQ
jgi:hypothetical protein